MSQQQEIGTVVTTSSILGAAVILELSQHVLALKSNVRMPKFSKAFLALVLKTSSGGFA